MGLSSKQVSRDGVGWSQSLLQSQTPELPKASATKRQQHPQNQQQQTEEVKCPRCDSSNTKFCYYNNYNKSQPRHFCKGCKRHWTKGGTLRNVPVGGGRKNKRIKTSNTNKSASSAAAVSATTPAVVKSSSSAGSLLLQQNLEDHHQLIPPAGHQKNATISNLQFRPPSSLLLQQSSVISCSSTSNNNGIFSFPDQTSEGGLQFPFSVSTSTSIFETTPSSISTSFQSPSIYNIAGETLMADPTTTATACGGFSLPWQLPITSSDMDMANYWNWDDIDALVSTNDLNVSWDDSEIKP